MKAQVANLRLQQPRRGANGANTRREARKILSPGYAGMDPKQVERELKYRYGSGLSESISKKMVTATEQRAETVANVGAGKRQLKEGARTIGEVATIFKQGAEAQAAAAAIAKARAVQEATGASDSQAAAFAQQLFMAKLQHKWALQEAEAATADAVNSAGEQMSIQATSLSSQAPVIAASVGNAYRDTMALSLESGGAKPLIGDFMGAFEAATGLDETTSEGMLAQQMFTRMQLGVDLDTAYSESMTATFGAYDPKGTWLPKAISAGQLNMEATTRAARAAWYDANPDAAIAGGVNPYGSPVDDDEDEPGAVNKFGDPVYQPGQPGYTWNQH